MLKKLAFCLLSLLLSLPLLPGQALAGDDPAPVDPPVIEEPEEPGIMPLAEVLEGSDKGATTPD